VVADLGVDGAGGLVVPLRGVDAGTDVVAGRVLGGGRRGARVGEGAAREVVVDTGAGSGTGAACGPPDPTPSVR
jgi:hypothetical protein